MLNTRLFYKALVGFIELKQQAKAPETGALIPSQGQIYVENADGTRGQVCDLGWGLKEVRARIQLRKQLERCCKYYILQAHVACRQAGYPLGALAYTSASFFGYGDYALPFSMSHVNCTGSENSLLECAYDPDPKSGPCWDYGREYRLKDRMAGVYCKGKAPGI